ncbi:hypothetical protein CDAR_547381 [Caerostris darwini]|uniref:Uncharacterized protein n=1 Tax=Caerostris darwini TaxID=1538125 RepID=A0AAV4V7T2_9ARAC|nr:hypothetical protein CDAR_547381 [Caerostris darwini]
MEKYSTNTLYVPLLPKCSGSDFVCFHNCCHSPGTKLGARTRVERFTRQFPRQSHAVIIIPSNLTETYKYGAFFPSLLNQSNDFPQTKNFSRLIRNPPRVPGPKIVPNHSNPPSHTFFASAVRNVNASVCFNLSLETREPDCYGSFPTPRKR